MKVKCDNHAQLIVNNFWSCFCCKHWFGG